MEIGLMTRLPLCCERDAVKFLICSGLPQLLWQCQPQNPQGSREESIQHKIDGTDKNCNSHRHELNLRLIRPNSNDLDHSAIGTSKWRFGLYEDVIKQSKRIVDSVKIDDADKKCYGKDII
ncbi:hypothetical protein J6590_023085 [Homalodisca vitripennis]|nr:hypothetical protein J6590_023085 [Homalodisca vitripennis]